MTSPIAVRRAGVNDLAVIARHRAEMFSDMGQLPPGALYQDLVERTILYLRNALTRGEYLGWLASSLDRPDDVIAGAGIQLRRTLPHPMAREDEPQIASGRQAIVLNVFTEKTWRRRGLAELLMRHVLDWARDADLDTLVLHASSDGRALYERLGFVETSEMQYSKPLR